MTKKTNVEKKPEKWDARFSDRVVRAIATAPSLDDSQKAQVSYTTKTGKKIEHQYFPLGLLLKVLKPHFAEYGLSISFETKQEGQIADRSAPVVVMVQCVIFGADKCSPDIHRVESGWMSVPVNPFKTKDGDYIGVSAQDVGALITYLKRYTLDMLIPMSADDDHDGNAASEKEIELPPLDELTNPVLESGKQLVERGYTADDVLIVLSTRYTVSEDVQDKLRAELGVANEG